MSSMVFGQKIFNPKPPIQGSFPLDHDGDCKKQMLEYMLCIRKENNNNSKCRVQAKEYLNCRMDHNLMEKRDLNLFGYKDLADLEKDDNKNNIQKEKIPSK
jgi:cytochrome c oxidase assembly protein subunit 19